MAVHVGFGAPVQLKSKTTSADPMTSTCTELEADILVAGPPLAVTSMTPAVLGKAPNTMKKVTKATRRIEGRIESMIPPREIIVHPRGDLCKDNRSYSPNNVIAFKSLYILEVASLPNLLTPYASGVGARG